MWGPDPCHLLRKFVIDPGKNCAPLSRATWLVEIIHLLGRYMERAGF